MGNVGKTSGIRSCSHILWCVTGVFAFLLPFVVCFLVNKWGWFDKYTWVATACSFDLAIGSLVANVVYHNNRDFYLWVNRWLSVFSQSHSYWKPSFRFELEDRVDSPDHNLFLSELFASLQQDSLFIRIEKMTLDYPTKGIIQFERGDSFVFHYDGTSLFVESDRFITVPFRLYGKKAGFLSHFTEKIKDHSQALSVSSEIQIQFENQRNPYCGFFVNSIPQDLLETFDISFRTDNHSTCEVIAGIDSILVKGRNLVETFVALQNVLLLKPFDNAQQ